MPSFVAQEYYNRSADGTGMICKLCRATLSGARLSNLKRHLITMHKINAHSLRSVPLPKKPTTKTVNAPPIKNYTIIGISANQLYRTYIGLVTQDNVPLRALNSINMRNIIGPICGSIRKRTGNKFQISGSSCEGALHKVSDGVRETLKEKMKDALLSIKVNTSVSELDFTYIISAHFWKEDALHDVTLGLVVIRKNERSSSKLAEELINTLGKYDIDLNQIVSLTIDRESHVCLASITTPFDDSGRTSLEDIQICECIARAVHQCSIDVLKSVEIKKFINNCRNVIRLIDKSKSFQEAFESKGVKIPEIDSESCWSSTYEMILGIKSARNILNISSCALEDLNQIPSSLWDFVEAFVEAMDPLYRTIKKFQEKELHYSQVYAQWLKCKLLTECIVKQNVTPEISLKYKIGTIVLDKMQEREISNECLHACLYLDPRFHRMLSHYQRAGAIRFLKKLWDKINLLNPGDSEISNSQTITETGDDEDELLDNFLSESINYKPAVDSVTAYSKIDCLQLPFMKSDTDVMLFWKDKKYSQPELYALSCICYAIPPTQIISDTDLSTLRQVMESNNDRTNETLENIFVIKMNSSLLDASVLGSLPLFENANKEKLNLNTDPLFVCEENANFLPGMDDDGDDEEEQDNQSNTVSNDESNGSYKEIIVKEEFDCDE